MTQLRAPLTFADAMTRVAGAIGWPAAARIVGRSQRAVRYWSEPGCRTTPTIAQALALDAAFQAAGGDGAPFMETYAFLLDARLCERTACRRALVDELAIAAREGGEAIALGLSVSHSNASPRDTLRAVAEAEEAHTAWGAVLRRMNSFLPIGAGSIAGRTGGIS
ncbi:hypothetical protein [Sphingomonas oligophenolica]|uniref:Uncharacterized protein n=1 Tax=Sphingomonas oligophenolica TaxID=301154 RepID=A0A502CP05_9SPHN|nr:hypothetical protein [Sphingomonas oligophenolica]TPG14384.1 hypothetical protein EAH84_03490 [Sphingomonas oligophenolica]